MFLAAIWNVNAEENPAAARKLVEELEPGDRVHLSFKSKLYHEQGYDVGDDVVIDDVATVADHGRGTVLQFDGTKLEDGEKKTPYGELTRTAPPELRGYYPESDYPKSMVGVAILSEIERLD